MIHYTLNTGHARTSPRSEVRGDVLAKMRPLTGPGSHNLIVFGKQFAGWVLVVPEMPAGLIATLYSGRVPVLTLGVAGTAAEAAVAWPTLESLYLRLTELPVVRSADFAAPKRPETLPWLGVILDMPMLAPEWAGDFERCLAWAWLTKGPS